MPLRDLLQQIAVGWNSYHQKGRVDKSDLIHKLVVNRFEGVVEPHLEIYGRFKIKGSTGAGNITAAPWMAVFDPRITESATSGYYVVYLFSIDLRTVTLCLAFGTTQFEEQFGGPVKAIPRMREAASRLQDLFRQLVPENLSRSPIDLGASPRQSLHYAYEQSSIFSYAPYHLENLPTEDLLISDLQQIVQIYTRIVSDPLTPELDQVVETAIIPPNETKAIEIKEFSIRSPKQKGIQRKTVGQRRRYSAESRKVGDAGEKAVVRYEREKLIRIDREDLARSVVWHGEQGEFPGWDITSFDERGEKIFIEVKSSVGKKITCVDITVNEWAAASNPKYSGNYFIYIVTEALSETPTIEKLKNPFGYVSRMELELNPVVFELAFYEKTS